MNISPYCTAWAIEGRMLLLDTKIRIVASTLFSMA